MNCDNVRQHMRVTIGELGDTKGMLIGARHIDARRTGVTGTVVQIAPGHGGDVWFVQHDDSTVGAYTCDEMTALPVRMEFTIYKYALTQGQPIQMPAGARVLCVQTQHNSPHIWAVVNPDAPPETRYFDVYGTGHTISGSPCKYIGTFQMNGGALVFHVFEKEPL